ncbi:hypothetical protein BBP40_008346 [Aspergillus hancockii]|nr:hypothetical protein BBP40_008346 [Aspergillus hancockii]
MVVAIPLPMLGSALLGLAVLYLAKIILVPKKLPAPLPPGPKPKPIIGNLGDLPPPGKQEWVHWLQFKKLYGPISSISMFGQTIVILNDSRMAFDLMEKRSTKYSSRPPMVFAGEIAGWKDILGMLPYSDRFRSYRKVMHRVLGTKTVISRFNPLQDVEVRRFLLRVLERPDDLIQHIRTEAVKHLPTWFPGAGFKKTGNSWKRTLSTTVEQPYQFVQQQMRRGSYPPSYLANLLEEGDGTFTPEQELVNKWTAASLYTGGADTTVSSMSCFFLAMALYPDVQKRAQEEIDRVIGLNKLPTFDDRERLPYIDALVKETLRWHPVAPLAIPHAATEDDIYEGYFIPKGSLIVANVWAFTHDPNVYHDPGTFKPERFLSDNPEADPHTVAFGFGRRICPGRLLADATIFLSIAQSLTVFDFSLPKGGDAKAEFSPGIVSHPAPYRLRITPRSASHEALIRSVEVEHPWEESHAKELKKIDV